ncbi:MAG: response regulator [Desulfobacteraceae bacterium]|nr:MAG: response regulator [Desulfobacteraceae bacterium]
MNPAQKTIRQGPPAIPPKILVMEDEPSVAKGLKVVLTEEGYVVDLAMSGKAALDLFKKKDPDLLVADLRLPDINGMEVIREVKAKRPEIGVVVITGYASINSAVDAMKLGSFDYLPKPFTEDEIKTAVQGALRGRQSVSADTVLRKVERREEDKLIQKEEVIKVLERTVADGEFWKALMEQGSKVLEGYRLSPEARAAIVSGDLAWIQQHVGPLSKEQLAFIYKRLERETW